LKFELDEHDTQKIAQQLATLLKGQFEGTFSESPEIMDVEALANYLSVKTDWLYKQVQHKSIPHFKAGKLVRFRRREIDSWIEKRSLPVTRSVSPKLKAVK
jgi:excisionase family DNA binding protein